MQLIYNILTFAVLTSALPPSGKQNPNHPQQIGRDGALMTAGQCHNGQHYCFSAIIDDLRAAKQDILHQYCNQKYESDWQSCNRCKRPWAMSDCWDGPGVWASVFECTGMETYKWVGRCEGKGSVCSGGTCRWAKVDGDGNLALVGNLTLTTS
ncbi:hypothetical protein BU25DRAFT_495671 [Macroventuria anomochaeta]|uniref:Uncharacterized protein n=1 Tax=Macroventuria anomochaeta TaxID=301207 RepID=A0ACB6RKJ6_9PLEO|nr:uncharacterized protein BU25DRAFT_495671 [Macroventuria anomochaeta]KAF2621623.1 hypothetical protein BU25DRAFT_495671 [Macroventuria anomochaeta]